MTILEASAHLYKWFNENDSFSIEKDFMKIYIHELKELPNIEYHGFLDPLSNQFKQIIQKCFAFIAPSFAFFISDRISSIKPNFIFSLFSSVLGSLLYIL